ncbi:MAG: biopolymer transport protein ExbD, partial [Pirellulaceae bacterium]
RVVQLLDICRSVTERVEVRVVPENPYSTYRLTIDADSVIKHDDQVIAREDLGAELAKIENSQQTTIILQVDATLATETNVSIFEECRNIGCQVQVSSFGSGN